MLNLQEPAPGAPETPGEQLREGKDQAFVMPDDGLANASEALLHRAGHRRVLVADVPDEWHPRGDGHYSDCETTIVSPYETYADGEAMSCRHYEMLGANELPDDDDIIVQAVAEQRQDGVQAFYLWVHGPDRDHPETFDLTEDLPDLEDDEVLSEWFENYPALSMRERESCHTFLVGAVLCNEDEMEGDPEGQADSEMRDLVAFLNGSARMISADVLTQTATSGLLAWETLATAFAWDPDHVSELAAVLADSEDDTDDDNDWCWFQRDRHGAWEVSVSVPEPG